MFMGLEAAIQKRYGIDQAIVVDVADNATLAQIKQAIGSTAAHYAQASLRPDADLSQSAQLFHQTLSSL